jgi:hypothetical protein
MSTDNKNGENMLHTTSVINATVITLVRRIKTLHLPTSLQICCDSKISLIPNA